MKQYFIRQIQYNVFILILPLCSLKKAHHRPKFPQLKKQTNSKIKKPSLYPKKSIPKPQNSPTPSPNPFPFKTKDCDKDFICKMFSNFVIYKCMEEGNTQYILSLQVPSSPHSPNRTQSPNTTLISCQKWPPPPPQHQSKNQQRIFLQIGTKQTIGSYSTQIRNSYKSQNLSFNEDNTNSSFMYNKMEMEKQSVFGQKHKRKKIKRVGKKNIITAYKEEIKPETYQILEQKNNNKLLTPQIVFPKQTLDNFIENQSDNCNSHEESKENQLMESKVYLISEQIPVPIITINGGKIDFNVKQLQQSMNNFKQKQKSIQNKNHKQQKINVNNQNFCQEKNEKKQSQVQIFSSTSSLAIDDGILKDIKNQNKEEKQCKDDEIEKMIEEIQNSRNGLAESQNQTIIKQKQQKDEKQKKEKLLQTIEQNLSPSPKDDKIPQIKEDTSQKPQGQYFEKQQQKESKSQEIKKQTKTRNSIISKPISKLQNPQIPTPTQKPPPPPISKSAKISPLKPSAHKHPSSLPKPPPISQSKVLIASINFHQSNSLSNKNLNKSGQEGGLEPLGRGVQPPVPPKHPLALKGCIAQARQIVTKGRRGTKNIL